MNIFHLHWISSPLTKLCVTCTGYKPLFIFYFLMDFDDHTQSLLLQKQNAITVNNNIINSTCISCHRKAENGIAGFYMFFSSNWFLLNPGNEQRKVELSIPHSSPK